MKQNKKRKAPKTRKEQSKREETGPLPVSSKAVSKKKRESQRKQRHPEDRKKKRKADSTRDRDDANRPPRRKKSKRSSAKGSQKAIPRKKKKVNWIARIFSVLGFGILLAAIGFCIFVMINFGQGTIAGNDMEPTFVGEEKFLYEKVAPSSQENTLSVERFDILVMLYPEDERQIVIKRLIGLPGEEISYSNGRLMVDGKMVTEPYYAGQNSGYYMSSENDFTFEDIVRATPDLESDYRSTTTIPANRYLVLGDNRSVAVDSRQFGLVDVHQILGVVCWQLTPFSDFGEVNKDF